MMYPKVWIFPRRHGPNRPSGMSRGSGRLLAPIVGAHEHDRRGSCVMLGIELFTWLPVSVISAMTYSNVGSGVAKELRHGGQGTVGRYEAGRGPAVRLGGPGWGYKMTGRGPGCNPALGKDRAAPDDRSDNADPRFPSIVGALPEPVDKVPVREHILVSNVHDRHVGIEALLSGFPLSRRFESGGRRLPRGAWTGPGAPPRRACGTVPPRARARNCADIRRFLPRWQKIARALHLRRRGRMIRADRVDAPLLQRVPEAQAKRLRPQRGKALLPWPRGGSHPGPFRSR